MVLAQATNMTSYKPPDRIWDLKLRSRESFKDQLNDVVELWKKLAVRRGDDVEQIDLLYVIRQILESGVDSAFEKFGGRPKSQADWDRIQGVIEKTIPAAKTEEKNSKSR